MREYGAEAITMLVCQALCFDHKPPLVANSVRTNLLDQLWLTELNFGIPLYIKLLG